MNFVAGVIDTVERIPLPDGLTLAGIDWLCERTRRRLERDGATDEDLFVREMRRHPIAAHVEAANDQHYELPPDFFGLVLGPRRKYSCCRYPSETTTLAEAEELALAETCEHADLHDGQTILELGCGWGSLTPHMAATYPRARIVAVSNSQSQRAHIVAEAKRRGLTNVTVVTSDMNDFQPPIVDFDRIVSVEMFEHMSNWRALLARARDWSAPDGRLFLHVFTHRSRSYRFDHLDPADWIARHFFTGGIMPAQDLPHRFPDLFRVEAEWRWPGTHYRETALDWLANFDAERERIDRILVDVYGSDADLWRRRWRLFFLATAGLFGHADGAEWGVGHYRLTPVVEASS
ncbi:SAM-dependent methyltransferase [Pinisolibacter aquiterrae]|uniref:SAM-dependent methyltransferase n=1 Tax=Pinisolibacter aquiterrae TaxID=2815579 RepID=UPI001C3E55DE|nr:cyclopropane-fatty-acyl-phospholipid synthase family protein [Pinisolibacter aquiterrae]MBV5263849.1 class I SAM-dependent methyltransferase [Pinisolibacter aquiterrae]MCC8237242.1 cyclopropane-fatty-acyl-phospholipid synthase family protein [Pinisolibacter aquiterrae]